LSVSRFLLRLYRSLRVRLLFAALMPLLAGLWWLTDSVLDDLRQRYLEATEETLVDTATVLAASLSEQLRDGNMQLDRLRTSMAAAGERRFQARIYGLEKQAVDLRVYVTDRAGRVRFDSAGLDEGADYSRWNDVVLALRGEYGARATRTDPDEPRSLVLHVAAPVLDGERIVGALTVGKPVENVQRFIDAARGRVVQVALTIGLVAVLLSVAVTLWITRPLRALTRYVDQLREGRRPRGPEFGDDDIGRLAASFESLRDALEGKRYVEHYVQSLTHEMKAPLTGLTAAAELLDEDMSETDRRRFLTHVRQESDRLRELVDRLLELAALESRKALHDPQRIDAMDLLRDVIADVEPLRRERKLRVTLHGGRSLSIAGEAFLLRQALGNLMLNAIDFAPRGSCIEVAVAKVDDEAVFSVRDHGPGMPDYAEQRAFERFFSLPRPDGGRKGTGLGLAFVREVAVLHGGSAGVRNADGGGTMAEIRLPLQG